MKTKNIFRTLLMAVGLLMGTMSAQAAETEIWSTEKTSSFTIEGEFANIDENTKIRVYVKDMNIYYWSLGIDLTGNTNNTKGLISNWAGEDYGYQTNGKNNLVDDEYLEFELTYDAVGNLKDNGLTIKDHNGITTQKVTLVTGTEPVVEKFTLTYVSQGTTVKTERLAEGAIPTPPADPVRYDNWTFDGWDNLPATMPAEDVTVTARFLAPMHKLYWIVNNDTIHTDGVREGEAIPAPPTYDVPAGYVFSGWKFNNSTELPEEMPNYDITISGSTTQNVFTVTYVIDDENYATQNLAVGTTIVPPTPDAREHYKFAWGNYPETMPSQDVTVNGSYTAIPTHIVTWQLNYDDNDIVRTDVVYEGDPIPDAPEVVREGYVFNGWSTIPEEMPNYDITISGTTTRSVFTVTYTLEGETVKTEELSNGAAIVPPTVEQREGYKVVWGNEGGWYPSTVDNADVTVPGRYVAIPKHTLTYNVDYAYYRSYEIYEGASTADYIEADPERDGYTFSGWDTIPETMPNYDITISGTFSKNSVPQPSTWEESSVTYVVSMYDGFFSGQTVNIENEQGNTVATLTYGEYGGADFNMPIANGAIDGFVAYTEGNGTNGDISGGTSYTIVPSFDGFIAIGVVLNKNASLYILEDGLPLEGYDGMVNNVNVKKAYGFSVMAGKTYKIYASGSTLGFYGFNYYYTPARYTLTYTVDGRIYHIDKLEEGATPQLPNDPTKTGYRFAGWSGVPSTMPSEDVTAEALFSINSYKLTYKVDGVEVASYDYLFGSRITPLEYTVESGNVFTGWSNLPVEMPAYDVIVEGRVLKEIQYIQATISSSTGYATFSYSEPLDFTNVTGLQAYIVKQVNETTAELEQVTGVIAAGTGLIIKGSTSTIPTSNTSFGVSPSGNLLVGVTGSSQTIKSANAFVLTEVNGVARFQATEGHEAVIPENHAYLSTPSSSRTLRIVLAGKTTDIDDMPVAEKAPLVIYDLRGHRVPNPKKGTLYIVNGKQTVWK